VRIEADVPLKNFGGQNGTLIFAEMTDSIWGYRDEIVKLGYGYSTLSEPEETSVYDGNVSIEMLRDWGWCGPEKERPSWCTPWEETEKES
jgi:hypothetical protein